MIGLLELFTARGFTPHRRRVKLVRHKDGRINIEGLIRRGLFEKYQQFQGDTIFDGCEQIVAFVGERGTKSRFVGVFDVEARRPATKTADFVDPQAPAWIRGAKYWYPTTRRNEFQDLENRLVIEWGKGTRAWHQWFVDREVLEIRQKGRSLPPFSGLFAGESHSARVERAPALSRSPPGLDSRFERGGWCLFDCEHRNWPAVRGLCDGGRGNLAEMADIRENRPL